MSSAVLVFSRRSRLSSVKRWHPSHSDENSRADVQRETVAVRKSSSHTSMSSLAKEVRRLDCRSGSPLFPPHMSCMLELPTYALSANHHPEPHGSSKTTAAHVAASTTKKENSAGLRPICRTRSRPRDDFMAPILAKKMTLCQVTAAAMCHITQRTPINTNRLAPRGKRGVASSTLGQPNATELRSVQSVHPQ